MPLKAETKYLSVTKSEEFCIEIKELVRVANVSKIVLATYKLLYMC